MHTLSRRQISRADVISLSNRTTATGSSGAVPKSASSISRKSKMLSATPQKSSSARPMPPQNWHSPFWPSARTSLAVLVSLPLPMEHPRGQNSRLRRRRRSGFKFWCKKRSRCPRFSGWRRCSTRDVYLRVSARMKQWTKHERDLIC